MVWLYYGIATIVTVIVIFESRKNVSLINTKQATVSIILDHKPHFLSIQSSSALYLFVGHVHYCIKVQVGLACHLMVSNHTCVHDKATIEESNGIEQD